MKNQFKQRMCFIVVSLFLTISSFADDNLDPFPDDTQDVPIDNWIPIMIGIGIALVFYYTSKRKTITEQ